MTIVKIKIGEDQYEFEFPEGVTIEQITEQLKIIGGRPKRD